jgi:16S rRNA (guanine527-N7)-methyltransferase
MEAFHGLRQSSQELLSLNLSSAQLQAFLRYSQELVEWNQRFNLTAITDQEGIEVRHFLDSLTCTIAMGSCMGQRVIDIGTGAGFPGIPLKIVCPQLELTLIEATRKKVEFCEWIVENLGLENVRVIHARAEEIGQEPSHRESYDWALARAVAPLPVLVEYMLPVLKVGGRALAQKGETAHAEVHDAEKALTVLGGRVDRVIPVELPGVVENRFLILIDKLAASPPQYPRRAGVPSKRPLG